jgi:hypothetical protein
MVSLVAAIPAYVQGSNPKCIEAVTRRIAGMLELEMDFGDLAAISEEFERKLHDVVQEQPELESNIHKLEEDYDNEIFNNEMGDLKALESINSRSRHRSKHAAKHIKKVGLISNRKQLL